MKSLKVPKKYFSHRVPWKFIMIVHAFYAKMQKCRNSGEEIRCWGRFSLIDTCNHSRNKMQAALIYYFLSKAFIVFRQNLISIQVIFKCRIKIHNKRCHSVFIRPPNWNGAKKKKFNKSLSDRNKSNSVGNTDHKKIKMNSRSEALRLEFGSSRFVVVGNWIPQLILSLSCSLRLI